MMRRVIQPVCWWTPVAREGQSVLTSSAFSRF